MREVNLFYKECTPERASITNAGKLPENLLLLHGAAFTSETWQSSIPTIQTMCGLGYRVIAVDLPGKLYAIIHFTNIQNKYQVHIYKFLHCF